VPSARATDTTAPTRGRACPVSNRAVRADPRTTQRPADENLDGAPAAHGWHAARVGAGSRVATFMGLLRPHRAGFFFAHAHDRPAGGDGR
jgi:hypothetical protein